MENNTAGNHPLGALQALHQQTRSDYEGTQNDSEMLVNDQCIFLRGLYVKDRLLGPQVMNAGAGYHDPGKRSRGTGRGGRVV